MKPFVVVSLISLSLFAGTALAQRSPELVVNYPALPVATTSGKQLQPEQVKQAIVDASARLRVWTIAYEPNGTMLATRAWNDHVIVVAINYSPSSYSMAYRDSTNMKYSVSDAISPASSTINMARNTYPRPAGAMIHPFYNRYVYELKEAITAELRKH